jgi:hypothetical protein
MIKTWEKAMCDKIILEKIKAQRAKFEEIRKQFIVCEMFTEAEKYRHIILGMDRTLSIMEEGIFEPIWGHELLDQLKKPYKE